MRVIRLIIAFAGMFLFVNCDNTPDNVVVVDGDKPENMDVDQSFSYTNMEGESLMANGTYKEEYLSLIATDEHGDPLVINGQEVADVPNHVEIWEMYENMLTLRFGRHFSTDVANKSGIGYYKLRYDENKYDIITVYYYYDMKGGTLDYITKIVYNGTEYPVGDIINIVKEE